VQVDERLDPWLREQIKHLQAEGAVVTTLTTGKPNRIGRVEDRGVWITTEASIAKGIGEQLVPAWMLNLAWRTLNTSRSLTNTHLRNDLNVKRSSAVCALLARMPGVSVVSSQPIELRMN
jgi:hypothetical protein